jgi:hypothetical protein
VWVCVCVGVCVCVCVCVFVCVFHVSVFVLFLCVFVCVVVSFVPDDASGCAARAAHGHQAQQRDGATESHSEHGENEENSWTQGVLSCVLLMLRCFHFGGNDTYDIVECLVYVLHASIQLRDHVRTTDDALQAESK